MQNLCPQKEVCGSCSWSHIPYDKQLVQKLSDVNGSLKLKGLNLHCDKIIPSPKTSHYRNRMDFVIDFQGRVGMREQKKWWKVIDGHTCFLADEKIDVLFRVTREWVKTSGLSFYDRKAFTGILRYAVIRSSSSGETMITIVTSAPDSTSSASDIKSSLLKLNDLAAPTTLIWSQNNTISDVSFGDTLETVAGAGFINEKIRGINYRISPNAFFQTNSNAAHLLINTVDEFCGDLSDSKLLDLYCGTGFFSVALGSQARETVGVEMSSQAVLDARVNAQLNNTNVTYFDAKTEEFDWKSLNADVVILDPPRPGMHDNALRDIMDAKPKIIVYVSCNPKNFAREMVQLQKCYRVDYMCTIDMFPHTPHVELISHLSLF